MFSYCSKRSNPWISNAFTKTASCEKNLNFSAERCEKNRWILWSDMAHKYGAQRSMSQREITGFWEHSGSRVIKYWGMSLKAKIQMVPLLDVLFLHFSRHFHFSHFIGKCLHTQMLFFCTSGCEIYKMGGKAHALTSLSYSALVWTPIYLPDI